MNLSLPPGGVLVGLGCDLIEVQRIREVLERHGDRFLDRVFTDEERAYCFSMAHPHKHLAARWAAKEAIFKAIGTGPSKGICWTDIEVRNQTGGRMAVQLRGGARDWTNQRGIFDVLITISHCRTYATAYALALGRPPLPGSHGDRDRNAVDH